MSLELTLGLDRLDLVLQTGNFLAFDRLRFRTPGIRTMKDELDPFTIPMPEGAEWYEEEEGLKLRRSDPYGEPLTYILARDLTPIIKKYAPESQDPWDVAVAVFVEALAPDTRIVLHWD
jgi:hypothetical protein